MYRQAHASGLWFHGTAIKGHVPEIAKLVKKHDAKTLLDYGCGKARYWREHKIHRDMGIEMPTLYDPGVKGYDKKPVGKFDGVICTDVLEHVANPEEVIAEILGYATKFAFLAISCQPSPPKNKFPDGTPFHVSVYPPAWWRERIKADYPVILRFDIPG